MTTATLLHERGATSNLDLAATMAEIGHRARVAAAYRKAGAAGVEGFRKVLLGIIASPDDRRRFDRGKAGRR